MNFKLILKCLVIIAVLALLVIMGMNNRQQVQLSMPNILPRQSQPAALMYFAFFAVGFLVGAILMAGGGKKSGGGASKSKAQA
jgi:uncharacterized membrane protein YciS (DUF1049 family)